MFARARARDKSNKAGGGTLVLYESRRRMDGQASKTDLRSSQHAYAILICPIPSHGMSPNVFSVIKVLYLLEKYALCTTMACHQMYLVLKCTVFVRKICPIPNMVCHQLYLVLKITIFVRKLCPYTPTMVCYKMYLVLIVYLFNILLIHLFLRRCKLCI